MANEVSKNKGMFSILFGFKNIFLSFLITVGILFIVSIIAVFTNMPDAAVSITVSIVTYVCVGFCGFRAAKCEKKSGLVIGALSGIFYALLLFLIGSVAFMKFSFNISILLSIAICGLAGAIGGIAGVNLSFKKKRRK